MFDKRSIFYLDDDEAVLGLFREMFEGEFHVMTATNPAEADHLLRHSPPDIIISDQCMPGVRGADFLRQAARAHPHSVRIMISGEVTLGEMIGDFSAGTIHIFVAKPFTGGHMQQVLARACYTLDSLALRRPQERCSV